LDLSVFAPAVPLTSLPGLSFVSKSGAKNRAYVYQFNPLRSEVEWLLVDGGTDSDVSTPGLAPTSVGGGSISKADRTELSSSSDGESSLVK
jgi:hypothetical protein